MSADLVMDEFFDKLLDRSVNQRTDDSSPAKQTNIGQVQFGKKIEMSSI